MDYDPPSAMTRFGIFFLAGGVALIFALWGVLKYVDHSIHATPAVQPPPTAAPTQGRGGSPSHL